MNQQHSITEGNNNQDWLTMESMAGLLGIAQSTLSIFLTNNPDLKEKHCKKAGKRLMASKALIPEFTVRKGLRQGSIQFRESSLKEAKNKMVEMASNNHYAMQELMSDPIIKLRLQQIESERRLKKLEEEQAELIQARDSAKAALLALPPATVDVIEPTNRANLVRLVREYEQLMNLDYSYGWGPIYQYMYDTFGVNVKQRAKTQNKSKIDIIEDSGHLDAVYAWAKKKYKY